MDSLDFNSFFPYTSYRRGQKEIIEDINNHLLDKGHYLVSAPNGTGKSIISLTSVLPIIYEKNLKLIYLCRTHQQNDRIIRELKLIKEKQPFINGISLRGRNNICINEEVLKDNPSVEELIKICKDERNKDRGCKYYQKFKINGEDPFLNELEIKQYNNPELFDILVEYQNKVVDMEELYQDCLEKEICPYYFIKELLKTMKIVVCNYLWVFHPFILRYALLPKLQKELSNCIIIVDECHNLSDTVLEINEIKLSNKSIKNCNRIMQKYRKRFVQRDFFGSFERFLNSVSDYFTDKELKYEKRNKSRKDDFSKLKIRDPNKLLNKILKNSFIQSSHELLYILQGVESIIQEIQMTIERTENKKARNWLRLFVDFWISWIETPSDQEIKNKYFFGYSFDMKKQYKTSNLCIKPLDPRGYIEPVIQEAYSTLHMSGTVIPEVYENLTSLINVKDKLKIKEVDSPFKKENIKAIIINGVTSAYSQRDLAMFQKINQYIKEILKSRRGNAGIFAVSYEFLRKLNLKKLGENRLSNILKKLKRPLFKERKGNSSKENAILVKDFKSKENAVLLGVLGGRNSEGEDFPGKNMEIAIIVGFPFSPIDDYVKSKIDYFERVFGDKGKFFAYIEPAIRKANQAAGRPIRKEDDKGVIIFLDERYAEYENKANLSNWITQEGILSIIYNDENSINNILRDF